MNTVTLEITQDQTTGFTLHIFRWAIGDKAHMQLEVGNRVFADAGGMCCYPYDEKIDGGLAELKRASMEKMLFKPHADLRAASS